MTRVVSQSEHECRTSVAADGGAAADSQQWLEDRRLGRRPSLIFGREEDLLQIPQEILKCVAFILSREVNGTYHRGTVFFVRVPIANTAYQFDWWVTAAHVINLIKAQSVDGKVWVRLNLDDGTSAAVPTDISDWKLHPTEDVAVLSRSLGGPFDHLFYPIPYSHTRPADLSLGDEVLFVGLFSGHPGNVRNVPIVRVGNIAAMPGEPIKLKDWGDMVAYLVEVRSIGGLSGAPVFVYLASPRAGPGGGIVISAGRSPLHLLGIMHGHFDAVERSAADAADAVDEKGREIVNMGIGIVVPIEAFLDLVNGPELAAARDRTRTG